MNKYKFRGKRVDNGEWVYGNVVLSNGVDKEYEALIIPNVNSYMFTNDNDLGFENWFMVLKETIGQYTGLNDKNGVEIYDGDAVSINHSNYYDPEFEEEPMYKKWNGIVTKENGGGYIVFQSEDSYAPSLTNIRIIDIEVIGNIHEDTK